MPDDESMNPSDLLKFFHRCKKQIVLLKTQIGENIIAVGASDDSGGLMIEPNSSLIMISHPFLLCIEKSIGADIQNKSPMRIGISLLPWIPMTDEADHFLYASDIMLIASPSKHLVDLYGDVLNSIDMNGANNAKDTINTIYHEQKQREEYMEAANDAYPSNESYSDSDLGNIKWDSQQKMETEFNSGTDPSNAPSSHPIIGDWKNDPTWGGRFKNNGNLNQ